MVWRSIFEHLGGENLLDILFVHSKPWIVVHYRKNTPLQIGTVDPQFGARSLNWVNSECNLLWPICAHIWHMQDHICLYVIIIYGTYISLWVTECICIEVECIPTDLRYHWRDCGPPEFLCRPGGLRPDAPQKAMSRVGRDTCAMAMVHACTTEGGIFEARVGFYNFW